LGDSHLRKGKGESVGQFSEGEKKGGGFEKGQVKLL